MKSSKTNRNKPLVNRPAKPIDPYKELGLDRKVDQEQIKRAYFQLVRQYPPESESERFQQIRSAYEQLRTLERRALADLFLLQPPPEKPDLPKVNYDLTVHKEDIIRLALEIGLAQISFRNDFHEPKLS
ncbi:MAG: molecular chaperone DnaJ [bacterium]|nr:MAG: molecular chaperone DnaJ [bacterium]